MSYVMRSLALASAYFLLGWLALKLATPGGYATAVFPGAGLAIVTVLVTNRRYWAAIFLGAFMLELATSFQRSHLVSLQSMLVALALSVCALLQANVAAFLLRQFHPDSLHLRTPAHVFRFMLLSGPVACLVASSTASASLYALGAIDSGDVPRTWVTWWIGDSLGAMIVGPPLLKLWTAEAQSTLHRYVIIPMMVTLSMMLWIAGVAIHADDEWLHSQFEHRVDDVTQQFIHRLADHEAFVGNLASYIESFSIIDPDEFRHYVKGIYWSSPKFSALSWCPRVLRAERGAFEIQQTTLMGETFKIKQRINEGVIAEADVRDEYYPVLLIEPLPDNASAIGFDLNSEPVRSTTIARAVELGGRQASERIKLVQYHGAPGLLLMQAVKNDHHEIRGVVSAVFLTGNLTESLSLRVKAEDLDVTMSDIKASVGNREMLAWSEPLPSLEQRSFTKTILLPWAGRQYELVFHPSRHLLQQSSSWQIWCLLVFGLLLACLLEIALLTLPSRRDPG